MILFVLGESLSIRCDPDLLKSRAKCLLRYIDGDVDRELQALYAVQALNHKLVNPPGRTEFSIKEFRQFFGLICHTCLGKLLCYNINEDIFIITS